MESGFTFLVCIKQVPDPETPPAGFKIDSANKRPIQAPGTAAVISPFDENAIEAALRLKENYGGVVKVLTMGAPEAEDALRHALALGADEVYLLPLPALEEYDSCATAACIAAAIKHLGKFDLILCGREAADWNNGQVGLGIAYFLRLSPVTLVKNIEIIKGKINAERIIPGGSEIIEAVLPALLTITSELGVVRYPNLKGILSAKNKPINIINMHEINSEISSVSSSIKLVDLYAETRERQCHIYTGDTVEAAAAALAQKIHELSPN
jgi:electron transfer flavoprotein beta subunit